ncbi:MAG: hypothetical protein AAF628_26825 [Planctomycetota bacterium]
MRSLTVVVLDELGERASGVGFTEEDHLVQALTLHRSDESLGDRVHIGRLDGRRQERDALVLEDLLELSGELAVPIQDEETLVAEGGERREEEAERVGAGIGPAS